MAIFSKDSLDTLRQRIDLVDVMSSYVEFKKSGAAYKGLCPFHDEKTPSLMIQKGDSHYHCFGCGAHGDAIQFLMDYQKMSFMDAVESLAQRFHVHLEKSDDGERKGPAKALLKEALNFTSQFYHHALLHTDEGHEALQYLYKRGLDLDFIHHFTVGLAAKGQGPFRKALQLKGIRNDVLVEAGLLAEGRDGQPRSFFYDRIMFPIHNASGDVIGFSGRKYKQDTFGGKYVNTPETPLFKKSRVLFGLNYSRRRIAKERKAIIVEGQIDALRLIQVGFDITVAGQGTAFGEGHVKELIALGINQVFLALDGDNAGQEAAQKIGNLFQKDGVEVKVVQMPPGADPDSFLMERGAEAFLQLLEESIDYLTFLVRHLSRHLSLESPAGKNELVQQISKQIRSWEHPLMVHESLRKLAHMTKVPEDIIGVGQEAMPSVYIKRSASIGAQTVDPDRILEGDLLRWLLLVGGIKSNFLDIVRNNVKPDDFRVPICRNLYETYLACKEENLPTDLLFLLNKMDDSEGQLLMSELMQKKVNKERAEMHLIETIQRLLDRNWMERSEELRMKISSGQCSDEEASALAKQFGDLKRNQPKVQS
jgi:DNA primase